MSERITEAELQDVERQAEYESRNATAPRYWTADEVCAFARELRRLRGLIEAAWPTDGYLPISHPRYDEALRAANTLRAEAEVVRSERCAP